MNLKKKNKFFWLIGVLILAYLMVAKTPMCWFPEQEPTIKDVDERDIPVIQNQLEEVGTINKYLIGLSMYPSLKPGMVCSCKKTEDYERGDIISFYKTGYNGLQFISHRIIEEIPGQGYITKGDNNIKIDPFTVKEDEVFCEVEQVSFLEYYLRGGKS